MAWTSAQIEEVCRIYRLNRFTICPDCQVRVKVEKGPDGERGGHAVTFTCLACGSTATRSFMTIGPNDFIRSPYTPCPSCNKERLGILMVGAHSYTQRCAECRHEVRHPLPHIEKKLIYLDQLAVSNLMFALNSDTKAFKEGRVDPFWRTAFEKLDRLVKLQLVICPETEFHEEESVVHSHFEALRRIYEHLSDGVRFLDERTVERFQLHRHALNWYEGRAEEPPRLSRTEILHGAPDEWKDVIRIVAHGRVNEETIDELRKHRDLVEERVQNIFGRWQELKEFRFESWYESEIDSTGRLIMEALAKAVARMVEVQSGNRDLSIEDLFTPPEVILVHSLHEEFKARGLSEVDAWAKLRDYLASPSMRHVPSVRISALLWTAIVRQAATGGRKQAPSRGIVNDIKLISTVLPYCEAVFIDKEMHNLLRQGPVPDLLGFNTRLFSMQNRDEFLAFLNEIEASASEEHVAIVNRLYGAERLKPYTGMFGDVGGG